MKNFLSRAADTALFFIDKLLLVDTDCRFFFNKLDDLFLGILRCCHHADQLLPPLVFVFSYSLPLLEDNVYRGDTLPGNAGIWIHSFG